MATLDSGRVAPRTGAWIETLAKESRSISTIGRPPHGGVDSTCFRIFGPYQADVKGRHGLLYLGFAEHCFANPTKYYMIF